MNRLLFLFAFCLFSQCQVTSQVETRSEAPKLVVVISIDQMRAEFLDRLYDKFGDDGFKRLLSGGYHFRNAHYNFMPTATGPGHSAIYSGAVPAVSGIIGNSWYDRPSKKVVNVVRGLDHYHTIGVDSTKSIGKAGPDRLLVTTLSDELKMATHLRSKVYSFSIKDRSAIMGAGHRGDGGFWFDATRGQFVTSSYYMNALPEFVQTFNDSGIIKELNNKTWETTYPIENYTSSRTDNNEYERNIKGDDGPTFPYELSKLNAKGSSYWSMLVMPSANEMVAELSKAAITAEGLGKDGDTDFLAVNFSSTDYAGHSFGPYSIEVADMYVKLDRTIADLLNSLDVNVGKDNYVVVLTADHGAVPAPKYLMENKMPGKPFSGSAIKSRLEEYMSTTMGIDSLIESSDGFQIYLNHEKIPTGKYNQVVSTVKSFLLKEDGVHTVITRSTLEHYNSKNQNLVELMQNGFYAKRSGDIFFITKPGWLGVLGSTTATGHGTPFSYDTHVPIIFYGKGIPHGETVRRVGVTDIAPTLSFLCRVMLPSGCHSDPLEELFEE